MQLGCVVSVVVWRTEDSVLPRKCFQKSHFVLHN